jgi:zinc transporter, ZIP family
MSPIRYIFFASLWTAIACGLWAVPFIRLKDLPKKYLWYANALASSMMIAASFDLIYQGLSLNKWNWMNAWAVIWGILFWLIFILVTHQRADKHDEIKAHGHKMVTRRNAFMIIVIMTMHSGAEWLAMWVAQWASTTLWLFVIIVMAIQNIPEWLAISLQLVPKWTPRRRAALWSIATSLPQPLMAVPAFYFVETFKPLVPWGLWFAAWCMIRMCFGGITAESYEWTDRTWVGIIATMSVVLMVLLQVLVV